MPNSEEPIVPFSTGQPRLSARKKTIIGLIREIKKLGLMPEVKPLSTGDPGGGGPSADDAGSSSYKKRESPISSASKPSAPTATPKIVGPLYEEGSEAPRYTNRFMCDSERITRRARDIKRLERIKADNAQLYHSDKPWIDEYINFLLPSQHSLESPDLKGLVSDFSSGVKQYFANGDINGIPVQALPDSGADMCFISPNLASRLSLCPTTGEQKRIFLANKKSIQSPGMVKVPWRFNGEQKAHILDCWILPGCVHDLVLGNYFLRVTQTLTTFRHRIKSKLVELPRRLRLRLLGEENQRLWGTLDGHHTAALADTGSDVMLVSSTYAQKIGLTVDRDFENWLEIEFADGTTAWTSGVVRNVPWNVGGKTVRCDFHVLDDLCVDVILSKNYLFELNVFSEHQGCFFDTDFEEELSQLCNIRLIGRYGDTLNVLEENYLEDLTSPYAFSPDMIQRELARRDQIRDEILNLPESQREAATQAEAERQRRWQNLRQAHRTRRGIDLSVSQSSNWRDTIHRTEAYRNRTQSSQGPPTGPEDGLQRAAVRKAWWEKKVKVNIPLRFLRDTTVSKVEVIGLKLVKKLHGDNKVV
ncbi:hypothetical protein F4679DRAFT_90375 [Xylaria curta]|nr:hypothetical protein F4679DRAFT_90375 [Xylaria curta]